MTEQTVTHSIPVAELSLDQLVQISQGLGREIDKLREQRAYLKAKIDERIAAGERNAPPEGDGVAPGADLMAAVGA